MHKDSKNGAYTQAPEHLNGKNKQASSTPDSPPEGPTKEANEDFGNNLPDYPKREDQADTGEQSSQSPQPRNQYSHRGDNIEIELPCWLWHKRIQRGHVNLLAGDPEAGKSFLAAYLCAIVTTGGKFPDNRQAKKEPVLILDGEQGKGMFMARLLPYDADTKYVNYFYSEVPVEDAQGNVEYEAPDITRHKEFIKQEVKNTGAKLVIVDPLNHFIGNVDTNNDAQMRNGVYKSLFDIAQDTGAAILPVAHLNKNQTQQAKHKINGSIANLGAPRSIFLAATDEQDGSTVLSQIKSNNAIKQPSLSYNLTSIDLKDKNGNILYNEEGEKVDMAKVEFKEDAPDISAEEALSGGETVKNRDQLKQEAYDLYHSGRELSYAQIGEELGGLHKTTVRKYIETRAKEIQNEQGGDGKQFNKDAPF